MASKTVTRSIFNVFYKTVVLGFIYPVTLNATRCLLKAKWRKGLQKLSSWIEFFFNEDNDFVKDYFLSP